GAIVAAVLVLIFMGLIRKKKRGGGCSDCAAGGSCAYCSFEKKHGTIKSDPTIKIKPADKNK
ncbi:MAG: FeoB-associated Cys-rich membrane protein, partial [Oscillospiraceae bacterium]